MQYLYFISLSFPQEDTLLTKLHYSTNLLQPHIFLWLEDVKVTTLIKSMWEEIVILLYHNTPVSTILSMLFYAYLFLKYTQGVNKTPLLNKTLWYIICIILGLTISKRILTNFSDSPRYFEVSVEDDTLKNVVPHSVATALASIVLPVPGGPTIKTP